MDEDHEKLNLFDNYPLYEGYMENQIDMSEEKFGHEVYAHTLLTIIKDNPKHMTIGLLGKWGTGKSSIINIFINKMKEFELSLKTRCVLFNAWKYSGDSIRRQLLVAIGKNIYGEGTEKYNELINLTGIEIKEHPQKVEKEKKSYKIRETLQELCKAILSKDLSARLIQLALISIVIWVVTIIILQVFWPACINVLGPLVFIPILVFLFGIVENAAKNKINATLEISQPSTDKTKLSYPEHFEIEFDKCIKFLKDQNNIEKLIIIIDDIDRCDDQTVVEAFGVVKQYAGKDDCAFIIPCDERQVINALSNSSNHNYQYESLRKFFDVVVRMNDILEIDLSDYTIGLINEYELQPIVAELIVYSGARDARKVKSFINAFNTNCWMIKERIKQGSLNENFIKDNYELIAIITAFQEQFIDFYYELCIDPPLLNNIQKKAINTTSYEAILKLDDSTIENRLLKKDKRLWSFLRITSDIRIDNINDVLGGKHPELIKSIENGQQLLGFISSRDEIGLITEINKLSKSEALDFVNFLKKKLYEILKHNLKIQLENYFYCCTLIFTNDVWVNPDLLGARTHMADLILELHGKIQHDIIDNYFHNTTFLENLLLSTNKKNILGSIVENQFSTETDNQYLLSLISLINRRPEFLNETAVGINSKLLEIFNEKEVETLKLIINIGKINENDLIPSPDIIAYVVSLLSTEEESEGINSLRFDILKKYSYLVNPSLLATRWTKLTSTWKTATVPFNKDAEFLYDVLFYFIESMNDKISNDILSDSLFGIWPPNPQLEHRENLLKTYLILYPIFTDQNKETVKQRIKEWLANIDANKIVLYIEDAIDRIDQEEDDDEFIESYESLINFILDDIINQIYQHFGSYNSRYNELSTILVNYNEYLQSTTLLKETIQRILNPPNESFITSWFNGPLTNLCNLLDNKEKEEIEEVIIDNLQLPISLNIKKMYIELIINSISAHPRKLKTENSEKLFTYIRNNDRNIFKPIIDAYDAIKDRVRSNQRKRNINILADQLTGFQEEILQNKIHLIELIISEFHLINEINKTKLSAKIPTIIQSSNNVQLILEGLKITGNLDQLHISEDIISALEALVSHPDEQITEKVKEICLKHDIKFPK